MPESWTALLIFLLAVIPGLAFDGFSQRRRPNVDESSFREASRVIQASVGLALPGLAVASLFYVIVSGGTAPNLVAIFSGDSVYFEREYWPLLIGVCGYLLGSVGAGFALNWVFGRIHGATLTASHSQWRQVFRGDRPVESDTFVRVAMVSGESWSGLVGYYSADLEVAGRELVLRAPIARASGFSSNFIPVDGIGALILRGDNIESIQVFYPSISQT